jgi:hypothetical protein
MLSIHNLNGDITAPYQGDSSNRWLHSLTNAEHHALPAISSSAVKYFDSNSNQAFYRKYIAHEMRNEASREEFRIGTLIHLAILEPAKFERYVKTCDSDQRTKDFKDYRKELIKGLNDNRKVYTEQQIEISGEILLAAMLAKRVEQQTLPEPVVETKQPAKAKRKKKPKDEDVSDLASEIQQITEVVAEPILVDEPVLMGKNGGYLLEDGEELYLVKSSEMAMYRAIQKSAEGHGRLPVMLEDCYIEQSGIAQCPITGLYLSCRGDARSDKGYFIDPKSINKITPYTMADAVAKYDYHIQHAHYLYVANLIEPGKYKYFYFLFVSKETFEVCMWHLEPEDVLYSQAKHMEILKSIAQCQSDRRWPSYDMGNGMMGQLPYWKKR